MCIQIRRILLLNSFSVDILALQGLAVSTPDLRNASVESSRSTHVTAISNTGKSSIISNAIQPRSLPCRISPVQYPRLTTEVCWDLARPPQKTVTTSHSTRHAPPALLISHVIFRLGDGSVPRCVLMNWLRFFSSVAVRRLPAPKPRG